MFAFQYAIKHLGSARVSIITPAVPVVALGLEFTSFSWISFSVLGVCVAVVLSNIWLKD
jgi:drug/metabolite transporter (DMT)-like permease